MDDCFTAFFGWNVTYGAVKGRLRENGWWSVKIERRGPSLKGEDQTKQKRGGRIQVTNNNLRI